MSQNDEALEKLKSMSGQASRSKYWSELSDSEKIERMRDIVKRHQRELRAMQKAIQALERHEHASDGSVMLKMRDAYYGPYGDSEAMQRGEGKDDVHF